MARASRHVAAALATEDLVIPQGAGFVLAWKYAEDDAVPPDWPTGWVGRAQVRDTYGGTLLASFHTDGVVGGGEVVLDTAVDEDLATYARVSLVLDAAESAAMTWAETTGVYTLELVPPPAQARQPIRMLEGKATLSAEAATDA